MTDDELKQKIDSFIQATTRVLSPKRTLFSWLLGPQGLDSYDITIRLQAADRVNYQLLLPVEPDEEASADLFHHFGQQLSEETESPDSVTVARLASVDSNEMLVIEVSARNGRWIRAFLPLLRDNSGLLRVADAPIYETSSDRIDSNLEWNAAVEVMRAFVESA